MKIKHQKLLKIIGKTINKIIPTKHNYIYIEPHTNCKSDKYDLVNCNADNALKVFDYFLKNYNSNRVVVYLECFDSERIGIIEEYIKCCNNPAVNVILIESCWGLDNGKSIKNAIRYLKNCIKRYRCRIWIEDTGWARFWDKLKSQCIINYNYCTPFKRGMIFDHSLSFNHIDYICQTSNMCAKVVSSEYETYFDRFQLLGFARNDTLFRTDKKNAVDEWLKEKGILDKKIIIYVPTYRPDLVDFSNLNIFGFEDNEELSKLLDKYNATVVTKLHPLQRKYMAKLPKECINFEPTYDFSIYDLFFKASILVSDYSSISTDFLVSGKPVIYLFSDIDEYDTERGFSFEPIQSVCCGQIAYNWEDLKKSLQEALSNPEEYVRPYSEKIKIWHKYVDDKSTKRCFDLLIKELER